MNTASARLIGRRDPTVVGVGAGGEVPGGLGGRTCDFTLPAPRINIAAATHVRAAEGDRL